MTFYIRKGNEVFSGGWSKHHQWSKITPTTNHIQVMAFTTRADAQNFLKSLDGLERVQEFLGAVTTNNLEYEL